MTHRTSNVSLTPHAMNGTLVFLSLFLSPVFNVAGRLATMGSGRISGSPFFLDAGGEEKKASIRKPDSVSKGNRSTSTRVCGPQVEQDAHTNLRLIFDLVHLSLVPGLENMLVAKLVFSLI